jgi:hypothetical protein
MLPEQNISARPSGPLMSMKPAGISARATNSGSIQSKADLKRRRFTAREYRSVAMQRL